MYNALNYGINVANQNGLYQYCLCPFHKDSKPSAWFNTLKGLFYCSVCGEGYNTYQLEKKLGSSYAGYNSFEDDPGEYDLFGSVDFERGIKGYNKYLEKRKIPEKFSRDNLEISLKGEVIFPCYNLRNRRIGSVVRRLKNTIKYEKQFSETCNIWPMQYIPYYDNIVLVEGLFSTARVNSYLEENGIDEFYCFSMIGVASYSLKPLIIDKNVLAFFDNDRGGKRGLENFKKYYPQYKATILKTSPDDMKDSTFGKFIKLLRKEFEKC